MKTINSFKRNHLLGDSMKGKQKATEVGSSFCFSYPLWRLYRIARRVVLPALAAQLPAAAGQGCGVRQEK